MVCESPLLVRKATTEILTLRVRMTGAPALLQKRAATAGEDGIAPGAPGLHGADADVALDVGRHDCG